MKRMICTLGALALGLAVNAGAVQAQDEDDTIQVVEVEDESTFPTQGVRTVFFGISGGASLPMGDFADARNTGFHGQLVLGIRPVNWPVGLRAEGMFQRFEFDGFDANNNMFAGIGNLIL